MAPFKLSQKTIKILQILNDNLILSNWELNIKNSKYDTKILKIWFSLLNKVCKNYKWTQWPEILDEVAFRTNALDYLSLVIVSLETYIFTSIHKAKLHELSAENLLQLECLIAHLGGLNLINPVYGEDPTPCTLIKFVLLEALEYLGFK